MIEDVEDEVYQIHDSDSTKVAARVFDKIYNGKDGFLPSSKFVDLVETLRDFFHSEDLMGRLRKVDPN